MRRVVVTGLGLISPLGLGTEYSWRRLIAGESGIGPITLFPAEDLAARIAGEVPRTTQENAAAQGLLNYDEWISPKERRKTSDFIIMGTIAAELAMQDAGWLPETEEEKERAGVLIGAGIGGLEGIYDTSVTLLEKGPRRVSPFFITSCLINLAAGAVSIKYGLKGPNHAVVTACASGTHAIGDAARLIKYGDADVMLAGGAEASVCRIGIAGFASMRALSTRYNDTPTEASRPSSCKGCLNSS
jgi:3-oxoacyl-[acyl-carrier-protein] synthase II